MHRSIWNENDSSRRRVKRCLGLNTHLQRLVSLSVVFCFCLFVCFFFVLLLLRLFLYMTRTVLTCNGY